MKAIVFKKAGNPAEVLALAEIPVPDPGDHEILVHVMARPFNPSDELFIQGVYRKRPSFPQTAGLEGSGIIVGIGAKVKIFGMSDHVAFRSTGTWAEYCIVKESEVILVDKTVPFELSGQLALNPLTAYALLRESCVKDGDYIVLDAASSALARIFLQLARVQGIQVIALVRDGKVENELLSAGARAVIVDTDPDLQNRIKQLTGAQGVTAFLDAVGGALLTAMIPLMAPFGKIILYGRYSNESASCFNADIIYRNLSITGFGIDHWKSSQGEEKIKEIYSFLIGSVIDGTLDLPFSRRDFFESVIENYPAYKAIKGKVILVNEKI